MSAIGAYDAQAELLAARYESVSAQVVHAELAEYIPPGRDKIALDVGAGSGRDAAWLASLGYDVVAVEPAAGMRREGRARHPDPRISWIDDRLPELAAVHRLGIAFDLILLSAVWMHVAPEARARSFRKLATLLKPGGVILMSLRDGPSEPDRLMWATPPGEIEGLARTHGLAVLRAVALPDRLGRSDVQWTGMCLRLPGDGSGALPLLRGIILKDGKSSTYKLGLLRAVARVADATPALAVPAGKEDAVLIPLGAIALNWLRMYLPLVAAGLPQAPGNSGPDKLDFAKEGFRKLLADRVVAQDLRIGMRFTGERADAVRSALAQAVRTISEKPAHFTTLPNSNDTVFVADPARAPRFWGDVVLDREVLSAFGTLKIPGEVWRTLQRLGLWVEPVLVGEWARLTRGYGERMGRPVGAGEVEAALAWIDPTRDTQLARDVARRMFEQKHPVRCVWTGRRLGPDSIDIDHCLPWSAWPCGDLWNLLPASPNVNRHQKKQHLPSASALAGARRSIIGWWEDVWLPDPGLRARFDREIVATLPVEAGASADAIFDAVEWRRLRLRQDQQIEEWDGARGRAG